MLRIRDFIETKDGLIFSVVSYCHPEDRYIAFLRYYASSTGDRKRGNEKFKKIGSTEESYKFLEKYPEHIFYSDVMNQTLQCVPKEKILRVYNPAEKLKEICENPDTELKKKVTFLSNVFPGKKGITGALLVDLAGKSSDIDFVIYGIKNYECAREVLKAAKNEIRQLNKKEWYGVYRKRFPESAELSFEKFYWHEKRKFHKGAIGDTLFDILLVRDFDETQEKYGDKKFKRFGKVKEKCAVTDATLAFDSPSIYKVECKDERIKEVVSYTHTYAGQAFKGEEIEVCGFLEEVSGKENYYRIVVGTTREAEGEYIKVIA